MIADVEYHLRRARSERDVAYRSGDGLASDIHMRLSALHLSQALLLQAARRGPVGNVVPFERAAAAARPAPVSMPIVELPAGAASARPS